MIIGYNLFRTEQNMTSNSLNFIPSFDSLPYLPKDPVAFSNQMKLIVSKMEIHSFKSLEDKIEGNLHDVNELQEPSIEQYQQGQNDQQPKDVIGGTNESFKTPKKKKKTGCVCKKTGCLKLYCECFSSGKMCSDECSCCGCSNTAENNEEVQSVRVIRKNRCKHAPQKKMCNCKKSQCQKKYCECFHAGVACNSECKCDGCCNTEDHANHKH